MTTEGKLTVTISGLESLGELTDDEWIVVRRRAQLVEKSAALQIAAMVKGILKYGTRDKPKSVKYWFEHLQSDAVDNLNYVGILGELLFGENEDSKEVSTDIFSGGS
jgi:hypothetical protein